MRVISLGAGVQSTAMLLMALAGDLLPRPDVAIFADTGWEPKAVYAHLDWLSEYSASQGVEVVRVSKGNLRDDLLESAGGKRFASIPFHLRVPNGRGTSWTHGMARRQCTHEYKLRPLQRKVKELGATRKAPAEVWLGISTDEIGRAKPSRVLYAVHRFPLIEAGLSRLDCMAWLTAHGFSVPPKSACVGCPFHDNKAWAGLMADPETRQDAIEVDNALREMPRFKDNAYLHRSLKPIAEIDFAEQPDRQIDLFENECEGMCGV